MTLFPLLAAGQGACVALTLPTWHRLGAAHAQPGCPEPLIPGTEVAELPVLLLRLGHAGGHLDHRHVVRGLLDLEDLDSPAQATDLNRGVRTHRGRERVELFEKGAEGHGKRNSVRSVQVGPS